MPKQNDPSKPILVEEFPYRSEAMFYANHAMKKGFAIYFGKKGKVWVLETYARPKT